MVNLLFWLTTLIRVLTALLKALGPRTGGEEKERDRERQKREREGYRVTSLIRNTHPP